MREGEEVLKEESLKKNKGGVYFARPHSFTQGMTCIRKA